MTKSAPRLLIVEEALRDRNGHWFEYNRATKSAVQGPPLIHVEMLGNQTMEPDVAAELRAIPHFRYTVWDQIYNQPQSWKRYLGVLIHNYRLYRDLSDYFRNAEYSDTVFAPTVVLHHLLAYHAIAHRFRGKKFGQLVLLIRNCIAIYDASGKRTFRGTARFWKWAIRRFQPMLESGAVRFVTDSERLADEFEELSGIRFDVLPHPTLVGLSSSEQVSSHSKEERGHSSDPIQIFLPGPARFEKGVDRLLDATRELGTNPALPHLQFIFQWNESFPLLDGTSLGPDDVAGFQSEKISFRTIRAPMSSDAYQDLMKSVDLVILPYRVEAYFSRISGVAVEAMMLGKPLLYTRNTWIENVSQQFGVGVPMDGNSAAIARAIEKSVISLPSLRDIAAGRRKAVAEFFSEENFRNRLIGQSTNVFETQPPVIVGRV